MTSKYQSRFSKLKIRPNISARFSAEDWNIVNPSGNIEGIADLLNSELEEAVNSGLSKEEVDRRMEPIIKRNSQHPDTYFFFRQVITDIFGFN